MSFHPRRILPPGATKKRKEGEAFYNAAPILSKRATTNRNPNPNPNPSPSRSLVKPPLADLPSFPAEAKGKKSPDDPAIDNRLLAGYLAHEFLMRGTILGQRFDPAPAEALEPRRKPVVAEPSPSQSQSQSQSQSHQRKGKEKEEAKQHPSYADVASMLKTDGAHVPGVVNPSQLVKWLHQ